MAFIVPDQYLHPTREFLKNDKNHYLAGESFESRKKCITDCEKIWNSSQHDA